MTLEGAASRAGKNRAKDDIINQYIAIRKEILTKLAMILDMD